MAVELVYAGNEAFPETKATHVSVEAAQDQAVHDLRQGRSPAPDRIMKDGKMVVDHDGLTQVAMS